MSIQQSPFKGPLLMLIDDLLFMNIYNMSNIYIFFLRILMFNN
jgi:hypothetical protein